MLEGIRDFINERTIELKDKFQGMGTNAKGEIENFINEKAEELNGTLQEIATGFNTTVKEIETELGTIPEDIKNFFVEAWNEIESTFENIFNGIGDFFSEIDSLIAIIPIVIGGLVVTAIISKLWKLKNSYQNNKNLNAIAKNCKEINKSIKEKETKSSSKFTGIKKFLDKNSKIIKKIEKIKSILPKKWSPTEFDTNVKSTCNSDPVKTKPIKWYNKFKTKIKTRTL